jgi:hypothetical protein
VIEPRRAIPISRFGLDENNGKISLFFHEKTEHSSLIQGA